MAAVCALWDIMASTKDVRCSDREPGLGPRSDPADLPRPGTTCPANCRIPHWLPPQAGQSASLGRSPAGRAGEAGLKRSKIALHERIAHPGPAAHDAASLGGVKTYTLRGRNAMEMAGCRSIIPVRLDGTGVVLVRAVLAGPVKSGGSRHRE